MTTYNFFADATKRNTIGVKRNRHRYAILLIVVLLCNAEYFVIFHIGSCLRTWPSHVNLRNPTHSNENCACLERTTTAKGSTMGNRSSDSTGKLFSGERVRAYIESVDTISHPLYPYKTTTIAVCLPRRELHTKGRRHNNFCAVRSCTGSGDQSDGLVYGRCG